MSSIGTIMSEMVIGKIMKKLPAAMKAASQVELATLALEIGTPYPPSGRPGDFPARRTGTLQQNLIRQQERGADFVQETLIANVPYAVDLERGHAHVAPRPLMELTKKRLASGEYAAIVAQVLREGE